MNFTKMAINKIVNFDVLKFCDTCCRMKQDEGEAGWRRDSRKTTTSRKCIAFFSNIDLFYPKMNSSGLHLSQNILEKYMLCTERKKHHFLSCGILNLYQIRK